MEGGEAHHRAVAVAEVGQMAPEVTPPPAQAAVAAPLGVAGMLIVNMRAAMVALEAHQTRVVGMRSSAVAVAVVGLMPLLPMARMAACPNTAVAVAEAAGTWMAILKGRAACRSSAVAVAQPGDRQAEPLVMGLRDRPPVGVVGLVQTAHLVLVGLVVSS